MKNIHVYPIDDIKNHKLVDTDCLCEPKIEIEGAILIVTHNAWDFRELYEPGEILHELHCT